MPTHFLAHQAYRDIESILASSEEKIGEQARYRYERLLGRAIFDVAEDPQRAGSQTRAEIASAARTYHLWHSRDRVEPPSDRVRRPRHFLLYRTCEDGRVEIGRVLHDRMDLARQLPVEYRPSSAEEKTPEPP